MTDHQDRDDGKNGTLTGQQPDSDKDKTVRKSNKVKDIKPITPDKPPAAIKEMKRKSEPHWQVLCDTWSTFYEQKFGDKPSFGGRELSSFKDLISRLRQRAERRKIEWTPDYAVKALMHFLDCAYSDKWLIDHFTMPNLVGQFDPIIRRQLDGKKDAGPAAPVQEGDMNELYQKFLSGGGRQVFQSLTIAHFDWLDARGCVEITPEVDQDALKRHVADLMTSSQASASRLAQAYTENRWREDPECKKDLPNLQLICKRLAVIALFKRAKELDAKTIGEIAKVKSIAV